MMLIVLFGSEKYFDAGQQADYSGQTVPESAARCEKERCRGRYPGTDIRKF